MTNWYFQLPRDVVFSLKDRKRIIHARAFEEYQEDSNKALSARLRGEDADYPYISDYIPMATKELEEAIRLHKIIDEEYIPGEVFKTRHSIEKENALLAEFGPEILS